jgi:hypothetical protein
MRSLRPLVLALLLGCTPAPEVVVVGARELGPLTTAEGVALRERGYSLYAFSRSVWLFGDTRLTSPDAQGSSVRGSGWSHTLNLTGEDGIESFTTASDANGGPIELFTLTAEELAFNQANPDTRLLIWPLTGVRDDQHDRVLLLYAKLRASESGALTPIGSSIAVWTEFEFGPVRPVLDAASDEPTLLFADPEPPFGQAALIVGEQLYAWGCADTLYQPCTLARVELEGVFERDAWEFWTGREWSPSSADAVATIEADAMFGVHYNPKVDRYLAIYGEREAGEILLRWAVVPEGPWSPPVRVLQVDAAIADVVPHPEYRRGAGQFEYLSYRVGTELRLLELELAPGESAP